jgi:hypothetical protein
MRRDIGGSQHAQRGGSFAGFMGFIATPAGRESVAEWQRTAEAMTRAGQGDTGVFSLRRETDRKKGDLSP